MNLYKVTYDGVQLGSLCQNGIAFVFAESPAEAVGLVKIHSNTDNFKNHKVEKVNEAHGVLFNSNGDY